ncbi:enoyl-CoA-hydratase DpgB [Streptomyces albireticuli]|uniref:enoyl-CoA-hydratase DpgB n=1 Tax=Streptomyces albireticuli TaxID=1940 RepID=UPI0036CDBAC2
MDTLTTRTEPLGGPGLTLHIDSGRPLAELTKAVDDACDRAANQEVPPTLALRLGATRAPVSARSPWPGRVGVQDVNRWERAVRRLERLEAVSIAVAEGGCQGAALDLLLATDYRIATPDLRLLLPVNDGHFWPGMAVHRLVNQIGAARTRQLVLWGHELSAESAHRMGLVDELTTEVEDTVRAAALLLGRTAGAEMAVRRQLLLEAATTEHEEALGSHLAACDRELRRLAPRDGSGSTGGNEAP